MLPLNTQSPSGSQSSQSTDDQGPPTQLLVGHKSTIDYRTPRHKSTVTRHLL